MQFIHDLKEVMVFLHFKDKIEGVDRKFISILAVLSVVYIIMFQQHMFGSAYDSLVLSYYISFITFAVIGYFLANTDFLETRVKTKKLVFITAILSAFSYISYICFYVVPSSLANSRLTSLSYFTIEILTISVLIFLLFKFLSKTEIFKKIEDRYGNTITTLSRYSYGIYLSHYLILYYLKSYILTYVNFSAQNSIIWIPLLAIVIFMISFSILWLLNKIPFMKKITGIA